MRSARDIPAAAELGAYWEPRVNARVVMVQPGGFSVASSGDLVLGTLLGSCVSACICDPETGIGGLNHFLLPDDGGGIAHDMAARATANASRYGVHAMEMLIDAILTQGGERSRLQAKLFGGANLCALSSASSAGEHNQLFAHDFLRRERIPVTAADLGGKRARRVFFKPATNMVLVQVLDANDANRGDADRVRCEETKFRRQAAATLASGVVGRFQ